MLGFYSESYLSWLEAERKAKQAASHLRNLLQQGMSGLPTSSDCAVVTELRAAASFQFQVLLQDIEHRARAARH